jgi:hypothetical protein
MRCSITSRCDCAAILWLGKLYVYARAGSENVIVARYAMPLAVFGFHLAPVKLDRLLLTCMAQAILKHDGGYWQQRYEAEVIGFGVAALEP